MEYFDPTPWIKVACGAAIASVGGGLAYVMRENDKGNRIIFWRVVLNIASSGFVGVLASLLCEAMKVDLIWSAFAAGVFGWLGANASIRLFEGIVYERLGIKLRANTEKRVEAQKAQEEDRP